MPKKSGCCASRDQKPGAPLALRSSTSRGTTRKRFTPVPRTASSAGRNVAEAAIETSGMSTAPAPIERMKGNGISNSSASPIATVKPENSVARPAVAIVDSSASTGSSPPLSCSRYRNTTSIE